jgi:hypothetical protein
MDEKIIYQALKLLSEDKDPLPLKIATKRIKINLGEINTGDLYSLLLNRKLVEIPQTDPTVTVTKLGLTYINEKFKEDQKEVKRKQKEERLLNLRIFRQWAWIVTSILAIIYTILDIIGFNFIELIKPFFK